MLLSTPRLTGLALCEQLVCGRETRQKASTLSGKTKSFPPPIRAKHMLGMCCLWPLLWGDPMDVGEFQCEFNSNLTDENLPLSVHIIFQLFTLMS